MKQPNTLNKNNSRAIDWELIWARKFRKNLYNLKKTGCGYTPIIREMVSLNSGKHPKDIEVVKLQKFLDSAKDDNLQKTVEALEIFYEKTVQSDFHLEILGEYKAKPEPPKEFTKTQSDHTSSAISLEINKEKDKATEEKKTDNNLQKLIKRLNEEINVRNYSYNTQKNYTAAVLRFLERLNPGDMQNWSKAFKKHLIWLHEKQGLAANTVNLHAVINYILF